MIPYADILVTLICVQVQARERERERREGDQRERDLIDWLTLFLNGEDISTKADSLTCHCYSTTNKQDIHSEIWQKAIDKYSNSKKKKNNNNNNTKLNNNNNINNTYIEREDRREGGQRGEEEVTHTLTHTLSLSFTHTHSLTQTHAHKTPQTSHEGSIKRIIPIIK